jgi:hypothetical protein
MTIYEDSYCLIVAEARQSNIPCQPAESPPPVLSAYVISVEATFWCAEIALDLNLHSKRLTRGAVKKCGMQQIQASLSVLGFRSLTHPSAGPHLGVGLLCNLMIHFKMSSHPHSFKSCVQIES